MIKTEKRNGGTAITIENVDLISLLEETTAMLKGVYDKLSMECDPEFASHAIVYCGQMAFSKSEEDKTKATNEFCEWLDKAAGEM